MKERTVRRITGLLGLCLCLIISAGNAFCADITLKLGHVAGPGTYYGVTAQKLKERVQANTNGKVDISEFGSAQFGSIPEQMGLLGKGGIDMFLHTQGAFAIVEPPPKNFYVLFNPYIHDSQEQMHSFFKSELFQSMVAKVEKAGNIKYIGIVCDVPPRELTTTSTKISKLSDLKGLKIRVPEFPFYVDLWKAWGASPTPVQASEMYTSLKSGLVEGQENDILAVLEGSLYEVQKHLSYIDYQRVMLVVSMSEKRWDSFGTEIQTAIQTSVNETQSFMAKYMAEKVATAEETLKEKGMVITRPDLSEFKDVALKLAHEYDGKLWEKGLYERVKQESLK